jgi:hypothetical protein
MKRKFWAWTFCVWLWLVTYEICTNENGGLVHESLCYTFDTCYVYEEEPVNRSKMDIKHETWNMWYSNLIHKHWYACPIALPARREPEHRSLLTVVTSTSVPLFQPLRHQRNIYHPAVNRFTLQTLPTINRKHFFMNILCIESFCQQKAHNGTLLFVSTSLKHGRHFEYWNQPLNMRMCIHYLNCHEAGLCCYLVIHKPITSITAVLLSYVTYFPAVA